MFWLQVLGAVAQLARALIAERTKAGLRTARRRGRVGGNPGPRACDVFLGLEVTPQSQPLIRFSILPRAQASRRCGTQLR